MNTLYILSRFSALVTSWGSILVGHASVSNSNSNLGASIGLYMAGLSDQGGGGTPSKPFPGLLLKRGKNVLSFLDEFCHINGKKLMKQNQP